MLTKTSTPPRAAASSTFSVPTTFVLYASLGVLLEQRQVLERGGVEHHVRAALARRARAELLRVADVGEDRLRRVEQRAAVRSRAAPGAAPHSSRSSIISSAGAKPWSWRHSSLPMLPPAPGDEHAPAGEVVGDRVDVRLDLVAAEQVGLGEVADVARRRPAARSSSSTVGSTLTSSPASAARSAISPIVCAVADGTAISKRLRARLRRGRAASSWRSPITVTPMIDRRCLRRVVVEEPDRHVGRGSAAQQRRDHLQPALAGAEDQELLGGARRSGRRRPLERRGATCIERPGHEHEPEKAADENRALRDRALREVVLVEEVEPRRRGRCRQTERGNLVVRAVTPAAAVEPDRITREDLQRRDERQDPPEPIVAPLPGKSARSAGRSRARPRPPTPERP